MPPVLAPTACAASATSLPTGPYPDEDGSGGSGGEDDDTKTAHPHTNALPERPEPDHEQTSSTVQPAVAQHEPSTMQPAGPTPAEKAASSRPIHRKAFRGAALLALLALVSQLALASLAVFVSLAARRRLIAAVLAALAIGPLLVLLRRVAAALKSVYVDASLSPSSKTLSPSPTPALAAVLDNVLAPQFDALQAAIERLRVADATVAAAAPTSSVSASSPAEQDADAALSSLPAPLSATGSQQQALFSSLRVVENALSLMHAARDAHAATTARLRAVEAELAVRSADAAELLQVRREKAAAEERLSDAATLRARLASADARAAALQSELLAATRETERARIAAEDARADAAAAREAAELAVVREREQLAAREHELDSAREIERERQNAGPLDRLRDSVADLAMRREGGQSERSVKQEEQAFWQGRLRGRTLGSDSVVLDELSARTAAARVTPPADPLGNVRRGAVDDTVTGGAAGLPVDGGFGAPSNVPMDVGNAKLPNVLPQDSSKLQPVSTPDSRRDDVGEDASAADNSFAFSRDEFSDNEDKMSVERETASAAPLPKPVQTPSLSPSSPPQQAEIRQPASYLDSITTPQQPQQPQQPRRGVRAPLLETERKPRRDGDDSSVTTVSPGEGATGYVASPASLTTTERMSVGAAGASQTQASTSKEDSTPATVTAVEADTQVTPPRAEQRLSGNGGARNDAASSPKEAFVRVEERREPEEEVSLPPGRAAIARARSLMRSGRQWGLTAAEASAAFEQAESVLREALEQVREARDRDDNGDDEADEARSEGEVDASVDEMESELGGCLMAWAKRDMSASGSKERLSNGLSMLEARLAVQPRDSAALFNAGLCLCLQAAVATSDSQDALKLYERAVDMYDRLLEVEDSSVIGTFNAGLACVSLARTVQVAGVDAGAGENGKAGDDSSSNKERFAELMRKAAGRFERTLELRPGDGKAERYLRECRMRVGEVEAKMKAEAEAEEKGKVKEDKAEKDGEKEEGK